MKLFVYRCKSKGGKKLRFSNASLRNGVVAPGAFYFSTYLSENTEYDELCDFLINYFNIPFETNVEIEL